MARNYAIIIGINKYQFLPSLNYAENDAHYIYSFLKEKLNFERLMLFIDAPERRDALKPNRTNIRHILRRQTEDDSRLQPEDSLWFFFSGHGTRYGGCDYLMPSDGDPAEPKESAIPLHWVRERLSRCGADNVVMILDACRNEGQKGGGFGSKLKGVTTIYSCKAEEQSWEIGEIQQGVFTYALLENFQNQINQGRGQTLKQVEYALRREVAKLNQKYGKLPQTPHVQCDSTGDAEKILLPQFAADVNIDRLEKLAYKAEADGNFGDAISFWNQILGFGPSRRKSLEISGKIQRLAQKQQRLAPNQPLSLPKRTNFHSPQSMAISAAPVKRRQQSPPLHPRKLSSSSAQEKTAKSISTRYPANPILGSITLLQNPVILAAATVSIWSLLGLLCDTGGTSDPIPLLVAFGAFGGICSSALAALSLSQFRLSSLRRILPLYLLIGFISGSISWPILEEFTGVHSLDHQGFILGIFSACILVCWNSFKNRS